MRPGVVAHVSNSSYSGRWRLGELKFKASLGKKLRETPISTNKHSMVGYAKLLKRL
jgi:hypothetical protein